MSGGVGMFLHSSFLSTRMASPATTRTTCFTYGFHATVTLGVPDCMPCVYNCCVGISCGYRSADGSSLEYPGYVQVSIGAGLNALGFLHPAQRFLFRAPVKNPVPVQLTTLLLVVSGACRSSGRLPLPALGNLP